MPVRIDIEGLLALLREREHYSVPFVVTPPGGKTSAEFREAVRKAIAHADSAARDRTPDDPTWTTGIDPLPRGIAAELGLGSDHRGFDLRGFRARVGFQPTLEGV